MNFLLSSNADINFKSLQDETSEVINKKCLNSWKLYSSNNRGFTTSSFFSVIDGYLRDLNKPVQDLDAQLESSLETIEHTWPVPQNITGSFSCVSINFNTEEVILFTDPIGVYPLYYLEYEGHLYISNSIIWIGAVTRVETDEAGVFQRCFGPEFCNLGRRTILNGCKRLLPGEWLKFNLAGELIETRYDNTLYGNGNQLKTHQDPDLVDTYWRSLKKELEYCLIGENKVNLALSGGMDSRILLGAVSRDKNLSCLSYGADENYEIKISRRLAIRKGSNFKNYHIPSLNFPSFKILKKYTLETEGVYLGSWLEILENVDKCKEPILIGDLSTAVTGRTIKRFSSKSYQKSHFVAHTFLNKKFDFTENNPVNFENWKNQISRKFNRYYSQASICMLDMSINLARLKEELEEDLKALFDRIDAHDLPYIELVDELFTWYTHTRFPMGKQVLINRSKFQAYCPSLSVQIMRIASSIPPQQRLNLGFVRKLFREIGELEQLSKIPTSQVPMVPLNYPHWMRIPMWGLRTTIDDYLIRRLVKTKDPSKKYRLFDSNNWVQIYQNDQLEENLRDYFENVFLGEKYINRIKNQALERRDLKQWPFANMNILNGAALNTELYFINKMRGLDEV